MSAAAGTPPRDDTHSRNDGLAAVRQLLSAAEHRELNRIRPQQVALRLLLTWTAILVPLQIAITWTTPWVVVLAFLAIGCAQNALILWTHEGAHYGISRNHARNDLIGDLLASGPTGITVAHYRWQHRLHHRYLGDPAQEIDLVAWRCVRGGRLFRELARQLFGIAAAGVLLRYKSRADDPRYRTLPPRSVASMFGFVGGNAALFALCALQGAWPLYFVLWVGPLFSLALAIGNLRTIAEHQPCAAVCDVGLVKVPPVVRVVRYGPIGRLLFAPLGFSYHLEHHAFPSIPHHRLREVRKLFRERGCFERPEVVLSGGYLRTLWQLAMQRDWGVPLRGSAVEAAGGHG